MTEVFLETAERAELGLVAPYRFLDLSIISAKNKVVEPKDVWQDMKGWLQPFTTSLWLGLLGITLLTGAVFMYVKRVEEGAAEPAEQVRCNRAALQRAVDSLQTHADKGARSSAELLKACPKCMPKHI